MSKTLTINLPQPPAEVNTISSWVCWAQELVIESEAGRVAAYERLKKLRELKKLVAEHYWPIKEATNRAHKQACADERRTQAPLNQAEQIVLGKISAFEKAQEAERLRLQAAEEERARKEQEKLLARAEKAEAAGKLEKAEVLREEAAMVVAPSVEPANATKIEGVSKRTTWKARVVNEDLVPREYLVVNQAALDAVARSTKGKARIPGVEFYSESKPVIRGIVCRT